jgi:hypothetical protein
MAGISGVVSHASTYRAALSIVPPRLRIATIAGFAIATTVCSAAAMPIISRLDAVVDRMPADSPPIVLVRDICGVYYEGRTKITRYCDDPYVCDRANPGKCKPGPELQRQLDAERQRREDAARAAQQQLDQMRRTLDAQVRNLRRTTRTTTYFARKGDVRADDRRGSGCNWEQNLGSRALYCADKGRMSSSAYDNRIIPSPQYGPARPPQGRPAYGALPRASTNNPGTTARRSSSYGLRFALLVRLELNDLHALPPGDPGRREIQRKLEDLAREYQARGVDVVPILKQQGDAAADAARERQEHGAVTETPPLPPLTPPPVAPQQAAADPPKPYSDKDEVLCSYLMTLAPDRRNDRGAMTRLGQPVPASCEPYLRSLPPQPAEARPAPEPAFYLPEKDKEEACKLAEQFYRENLFPPDYADLSVTERAYHSRRAYLCLTDRR